MRRSAAGAEAHTGGGVVEKTFTLSTHVSGLNGVGLREGRVGFYTVPLPRKKNSLNLLKWHNCSNISLV